MRFLALQWVIRPHPPTPLPHCERGANLKQVYRVVMLSEAWITHIFCPLLNVREKGVGAKRGANPPNHWRDDPALRYNLPVLAG
jgi:hypothetical protein